MFLLFGTRATQAVINVVAFVCGYCGVHAQQRVLKRSTKLTLFFVPLFPISTSYMNQCTHCGALTRITADQARHSLAWTADQARGVR